MKDFYKRRGYVGGKRAKIIMEMYEEDLELFLAWRSAPRVYMGEHGAAMTLNAIRRSRIEFPEEEDEK